MYGQKLARDTQPQGTPQNLSDLNIHKADCIIYDMVQLYMYT